MNEKQKSPQIFKKFSDLKNFIFNINTSPLPKLKKEIEKNAKKNVNKLKYNHFQKEKYQVKKMNNSVGSKSLTNDEDSHYFFFSSMENEKFKNSVLKLTKYDKIMKDIERIIENFIFDALLYNDEITSKCFQLNIPRENLKHSSGKKNFEKGFPVYFDIEDLKIKEKDFFFMNGVYTKNVSGNILRFYNIFGSSTVRLYKTLKVN